MFLGRWIGWVLVALSLMALGGDALNWLESGQARFGELGAFWYQLDAGSLTLLQALMQRYLPAYIWDPDMTGLLHQPGAIVLAAIGVAAIWLFRKPAEKQRARFGALS